jgi:uncharacterized repeat protein (TIGR03803 family)
LIRNVLGACCAVALIASCGGGSAAGGLGPIVGAGASSTSVREVSPRQFTTVYAFTGPPADGGNPLAALSLGSNGNFYGTTDFGGGGKGFHNHGTVFEMSPSGSERVLYAFQGGADGEYPEAGVTEGSGGVLYGATQSGGSAPCGNGCGTVFALVPSGSGYAENILHTFGTVNPDGRTPLANVLVDGHGNIYGTTIWGGGTSCVFGSYDLGCGVVYELSPGGSGYTEKLLYRFRGGNDGAYPSSSLTMDALGRIYGTTQFGGGTSCHFYPNPSGCGTVFRITPEGHETVLYRFQGGTDGADPLAGLLSLKGQRLIGATFYGGSSVCSIGCGTVFELDPSTQAHTGRVIHRFGDSVNGDGALPSDQNGLVADANGNIFGTTTAGGAGCGETGGCGTVFDLSPSASGYSETVLHSFIRGTAPTPQAGLTLDAGGQLYGVMYDGVRRVHGCENGCGTVFRIAP